MNFIQTIKAVFACAWAPLYFGGGGGSSSAQTSTATTTSSSQVNTDQSMMGGDNAVGVNGTGNLIDKSVVNNTAFNDSSNRSTNFADSSNRSSTTNFADSSDRSVHNTTTDFGSVTAALSGMGQLSSAVVGQSGQMVRDGLSAVASQSKDNITVLDKAFNFAAGASATNAANYADVLGFAKDTIKKTSDAYADAKDGGTNKTLQIAAVATVAAVGLAFALR